MQFFKILTEIIEMHEENEEEREHEQNLSPEDAETLNTLIRVLPNIASIARPNSYSQIHESQKLAHVKMKLFLEEHGRGCEIAMCSATQRDMILLGATARGIDYITDISRRLLKALDIVCGDMKIEEVTLESAKALSELSSENGFIRHSGTFFERLEIDSLLNIHYSNPGFKFREEIIATPPGKDMLIKKAERLLCCGSLVPEIERIFMPAKRVAAGHPVHYLIQSDNDEVGEEITKILFSALYSNGRIKSRRYCLTDLKGVRHWGSNCTELYETFYKSCEGSAIAVKLVADIPEEDNVISAEAEKLEHVCRTAAQNRNETLTIFRLPRAAERLKAIMREHLGTMTLVEITEDNVSGEMAKEFLKQNAREKNVRADRALYKTINDPLKTYSISDLHEAFRIWYDNQLRTCCFTQYANFDTAGKLVSKKGKPRGDAHSELDKMIGLSEAKSVICQAVDYFKAQKLFKDRGITMGRPAMHMAFTGSPGTAKTSAARLFAQIMKDNGLLSVGSLVEVGRADLVGKYVGWTARIVQNKFIEAKGSVLFIDEAYSLVDDKNGMYGDEAINTIVQEMENRREDIVVIFAGYTDKMEEFLRRNPGLRSRIAFHVHFADYSTDELLQILEHLAGKQSMTLDESVKGKLVPILEKAKSDVDFGNGRYMRNLLEKARMKQATRLLGMNVDKVTKKDLTTLIADDFEAQPKMCKEIKQIGFCA